MTLVKHPNIYTSQLADAESVNRALISGFLQYRDSEASRHSHYFAGRHENIYIDDEHIPALRQVKQVVRALVAEITGMQAHQLKAGLWFNAMGPGHKTLPHRHDDDDEIMSAVYYVDVPENSGSLVLSEDRFSTRVTPEAGLFVLFPPDMMHEVTENLSQQLRLSLGINIGPVEPLDD